MSVEIGFTQAEHITCALANLIERNKSYWIAIGGQPLLAMLLARKLNAPDVCYVVEDGTISPQPTTSASLVPPGASGGPHYRAVAWKDMSTMSFHCASGYYDYGILDCLEVDMYGNINSSCIGDDWEHPIRRFGGAGGANEMASMCWGTILLAEQEKRKYKKRVQFITSPGYLDGSPGAREKAGLPAGTGPCRVISDKAIFGFDEGTKLMKLLAIAPWTTVEEVLAEMEFEPLIAEPLDMVKPPTEEQLGILRTEIDPEGQIIGRGQWISYKPETLQ
jgi:glutaconate CoA-transferase subunit B